MAKEPKRPDLSSGWTSYEVVEKDTNGVHTVYPFSMPLTVSGTTPTPAVTKIRIVQDLGWPRARNELVDKKGHHLIVPKDDVIWLLKCKPSCWRLYFYVREKSKRFIYVYAACKKRNKEDPASAREARNVADRARSGESEIDAIKFTLR